MMVSLGVAILIAITFFMGFILTKLFAFLLMLSKVPWKILWAMLCVLMIFAMIFTMIWASPRDNEEEWSNLTLGLIWVTSFLGVLFTIILMVTKAIALILGI